MRRFAASKATPVSALASGTTIKPKPQTIGLRCGQHRAGFSRRDAEARQRKQRKARDEAAERRDRAPEQNARNQDDARWSPIGGPGEGKESSE